ncbi:MAG: hypothetical protein GY859_28975 [Desulfobacterales bacterium]|nr:hypothetical protein [Desulfobacterales bacterium]
MCYDSLQAGIAYAASDDNPATRVEVGAGEYNEVMTISGSMVVILREGTVILGSDAE